jgi:hypothetical protein
MVQFGESRHNLSALLIIDDQRFQRWRWVFEVVLEIDGNLSLLLFEHAERFPATGCDEPSCQAFWILDSLDVLN